MRKQYGKEEAPALTVRSDIFGTVFNSQTVDYGDTCAVFALETNEIDDSKIDSSRAAISLEPGDGYYPEEFVFSGTELKGEWKNGRMTYALSADDLVYRNSGIGAGWTTLGGDGAGHYTFNLRISGILYDGRPVEAQTFRIRIYCYGRDFKADAIELYGDKLPKIAAHQTALKTNLTAVKEPLWVWIGEDEINSKVPLLCDEHADNFYVLWPEGTDSSSLSAQDVVITLKSEYGDEKSLTPGADYVVFAHDKITQIAVTYQNLSFIPVYSKMTIAVNHGEITACAEYDIASVYVYYTMFGGPAGTRRGWLFYGFDLNTFTNPQQLLKPMLYVLKLKDSELYYSEKKGLVDSVEEATAYDGCRQRDVSLNKNYLSLLLINKPAFPMYEEKKINGVTYRFELIFHTENTGPTAVNTMLYSPASILTERCRDTWYPIQEYPVPDLLPGYAIAWNNTSWITLEKWAWMNGVDIGWRTVNVQYSGGKIVYTNKTPRIELEKGTKTQFLTPDVTDKAVSWSVTGDHISGTAIDQNGLLTVPADETAASVTVRAQTDEPFGDGLVRVTLLEPVGLAKKEVP